VPKKLKKPQKLGTGEGLVHALGFVQLHEANLTLQIKNKEL
jgi:hypothetical protein